jgi:hypothetical protein
VSTTNSPNSNDTFSFPTASVLDASTVMATFLVGSGTPPYSVGNFYYQAR